MRVVALKQTHYQSGEQFPTSMRKLDARGLYVSMHFTRYIRCELLNDTNLIARSALRVRIYYYVFVCRCFSVSYV